MSPPGNEGQPRNAPWRVRFRDEILGALTPNQPHHRNSVTRAVMFPECGVGGSRSSRKGMFLRSGR